MPGVATLLPASNVGLTRPATFLVHFVLIRSDEEHRNRPFVKSSKTTSGNTKRDSGRFSPFVALRVSVGAPLLCYFRIQSSLPHRTRLWRDNRCSFAARSEMSALLKRIIRCFCPHRSWPQCGIEGQESQVCLIYGTAFEYYTEHAPDRARCFC
jgi:hypothetical protein